MLSSSGDAAGHESREECEGFAGDIPFEATDDLSLALALSTGLFSSDKSKETINAGLAEASGTLELRGSIIAKANGGKTATDEISMQVANAAGGGAVDLTPGETLITYTDAD